MQDAHVRIAKNLDRIVRESSVVTQNRPMMVT